MSAAWFGIRLKELREAAGLTQSELAEKAGMTREGIAQLETGRRKPAWESVLALTAALDVDCTVFTQPPSTTDRPGPGRPPKAKPVASKPKQTKSGKSTGKQTKKG